MQNRIAGWLATWFGCGYAPGAPGSVASACALGLAWVPVKFCGWRPGHFAVLALVLVAPAMWAAHRKALQIGQKDPRVIVIDEVLGQWVTLAGATALDWKGWLAAFLLFRLFDIFKPVPIRRLEALPGGFGIVADDLAAGIYGALVLFAAGCFNLY